MTRHVDGSSLADESIRSQLGSALRAIRLRRGLRLEDVRVASGGRFSATGVAGYERGERAISMERFCQLCATYHVQPERVLADVVRASEGRPPVRIAVAEIARLDARSREVVGSFVERVARVRGMQDREVVTIRTADLQVLATATEMSADALMGLVGPEPEHDQVEPEVRSD